MFELLGSLLSENLSISNWLLQAMAMSFTALLLPGLRITSITGPFITVFSLSLVNVFVWDAALFFQIPDSFTMHTLIAFLANGLLFWILVKVLPGIEISGFLPALLAPVIFTLCNLLIDTYGDQVDWKAYLATVADLISYLKGYLLTEAAPAVTSETVAP